jgi:hypothetical protein
MNGEVNKKKLQQEMDDAAELAKQELDSVPVEAKKHVAVWMKKWFPKAGWRRLGRMLLVFAEKAEEDERAHFEEHFPK